MPESTILTCPKCESPMDKVEFARVTVDRCTICGGIWFDGDEHEKLKKMTATEGIDTGGLQTGAKRDRPVTEMKCPRCQGPMTTVQDAEQPHIEYEVCQDGHGAFFDAGEFRDFKEVTVVRVGQGAVAAGDGSSTPKFDPSGTTWRKSGVRSGTGSRTRLPPRRAGSLGGDEPSHRRR